MRKRMIELQFMKRSKRNKKQDVVVSISVRAGHRGRRLQDICPHVAMQNLTAPAIVNGQLAESNQNSCNEWLTVATARQQASTIEKPCYGGQ